MIDTATAGQRSFSVTGTDNVANVTTVNHTYTVEAPAPHELTAHIAVAISEDKQVYGGGWLPSVDVTVTLDSVATGPGVDYGGVFTPDADRVWGTLQQVWPIEPGDLVTVSDGLVTKTYTVAPLTMSIDPIGDSVSGTSTAGADVSVLIEHIHRGQEIVHAIADPATGEFLAQFTWFDIRHDAGGVVFDHDADGNSTRICFKVWSPDDFDVDGVLNGAENCP